MRFWSRHCLTIRYYSVWQSMDRIQYDPIAHHVPNMHASGSATCPPISVITRLATCS